VARECVVVDCIAAGSDLYSSSCCTSGRVRLPRRYVWCDVTHLFHILQYTTTYSNTLQRPLSVLLRVMRHDSFIACTATRCNLVKHSAAASIFCAATCGATRLIHCMHCNMLQHAATYSNTLHQRPSSVLNRVAACGAT